MSVHTECFYSVACEDDVMKLYFTCIRHFFSIDIIAVITHAENSRLLLLYRISRHNFYVPVFNTFYSYLVYANRAYLSRVKQSTCVCLAVLTHVLILSTYPHYWMSSPNIPTILNSHFLFFFCPGSTFTAFLIIKSNYV